MFDNYLTLKEEVKKVLDVFTNEDKVFTAFDVTMALRKVIKGTVKHSEVKDIIFQEWKDTFCESYESTLTKIDIGGGITTNAYVYHPENVPATTHFLAVQDADEEEDNSFIAVNIAYTTRELSTSEKRLSIPKEMLIKNNMKAGDVVYADTSDSQKITIKKDNSSNSNMSIYSINADGRLRFSKAILDKVFKKESDKYNIYATFKKNIIEVMPFV
jgi:bifunctional DNA-binding transcriptional regulator/antitoxin component of YhaV-PrlF toxin-antitoxin module